MRIIALALTLALGGALASGPADAHSRSRVTVGVGFGFGYPYWGSPWGPWYYPPPYYYAPAVVVPSQPVTYIEQGSPQPVDAGSGGGWWFYCDSAKGYYPYVKECPAGWLRVAPTPTR